MKPIPFPVHGIWVRKIAGNVEDGVCHAPLCRHAASWPNRNKAVQHQQIRDGVHGAGTIAPSPVGSCRDSHVPRERIDRATLVPNAGAPVDKCQSGAKPGDYSAIAKEVQRANPARVHDVGVVGEGLRDDPQALPKLVIDDAFVSRLNEGQPELPGWILSGGLD